MIYISATADAATTERAQIRTACPKRVDPMLTLFPRKEPGSRTRVRVVAFSVSAAADAVASIVRISLVPSVPPSGDARASPRDENQNTITESDETRAPIPRAGGVLPFCCWLLLAPRAVPALYVLSLECNQPAMCADAIDVYLPLFVFVVGGCLQATCAPRAMGVRRVHPDHTCKHADCCDGIT